MAKKAGAKGQPALFPEVERLIALLNSEPDQDIVVVVVPSHDRHNKVLGDARMGEWASQALHVLADLYRGGTAYKTFKGIFKTDDGQYLYDEPILIESYASHADIANPTKLQTLVGFAKRMGRELNQAAIMLVIGRVMFYIEDYTGA